jgi:hypothetical protein
MHEHMAGISLETSLMTLEGSGPVLEVAREVSRILRETNTAGAVIGGVAVALHGYLRTTVDVDVLVAAEASALSEHLQANGFVFDTTHQQFVKHGVPVHFVTESQAGALPQQCEQINGIQTIPLADLINIKLRSGSNNILRAKDIGDVIGLMRHHRLTKDYVPQIDKDLRDAFRKLIDAMDHERGTA